ncbi:DNA repair protein RadC [bacterium]|nr:DNA repair protein RadC [bacterium]
MSDAELLATILGDPARVGFERLLAEYGDLRRLAAAHPLDWREAGMRKRAVLKLGALFELAKRYGETEWLAGQPFKGAYDVYAHYRERLAAEPVEFFIAVLLDNKHRKIRDTVVGQGSLTASIVHPRDVYSRIVRDAAAAVIFVHNHPSGDPTPSREDLDITRRLREVGDLIGVHVLDHVVIGKGRYVSFVDDGYW